MRGALCCALAVLVLGVVAGPRSLSGDQTGPPIPMAILGDSDSHSYQAFPPEARGGVAFRAVTLQWTEILERLRSREVDLGAWGVWGTRRRYALLRRVVRLETRYPMKEDFRNNMALSGARCEDLTSGLSRQVSPLLGILRREPEAWSRGIVVIRIGINSMGRADQLDQYAETGLDAAARSSVDDCMEHISSTIRSVRSVSPNVKLALVGVAEDPNGAGNADRWRSPTALSRIRQVLDYFDERLTALAAFDPAAVFVEDRAWWVERFGGRDGAGSLAPKSVSLGGPTSVTNSVGDHPTHAVTADGHAGTVTNGLWLNHLVSRLNQRFGLGLTPLSDGEIAYLVDPVGALGIAPTGP